jgi:hypothetical protein
MKPDNIFYRGVIAGSASCVFLLWAVKNLPQWVSPFCVIPVVVFYGLWAHHIKRQGGKKDE